VGREGMRIYKDIFVWLKLKIETKWRKGKYVSKIKSVMQII
jgi:hypothetical protein